MSRIRYCVTLAIALVAMTFVLGCGAKDVKPLQVALDMTGAEVEKILGAPQAKESAGDREAVWKYASDQRAVEITLRDDRVARILQFAVGKDESDIQGTWKLVSAMEGGSPKGGRDLRETVFVIGGGKITVQETDGRPDVAEYRLDPSASPKTIDILVSSRRVTKTGQGVDEKEPVRGIYALAGDDLKICFREPGNPRPAAFESKADPEAVLLTLKRQSRQWSHPPEPPRPELKDKPKKTTGYIDAVKTQIGSLRAALDSYAIDCKDYPTIEQGLYALVKRPSDLAESVVWTGPYLPAIPKDPWGNDYQYAYPPTSGHGDAPDIWSFGPDGEDGTEDDICSWHGDAETQREGGPKTKSATTGPAKPAPRGPGVVVPAKKESLPAPPPIRKTEPVITK